MADDPAKYTWSEKERQFRDKFGRFVARTEVRASLDTYLDALQLEAGEYTQDLADQKLSISQWQLKMESLIKRGHVAATAIAVGGHKQAKPSHWGEAGYEIRYQYDRLARFAKQLEDGRPVHGGTISRAKMYALAPTSTYEKILRRGDFRAGFDRERRILHSEDSCERCEYYAGLGWQPAGVLPDIGTQSQCLSRCRCTFQRERSPEARKRRGLSVMATDTGKLEATDDRCQRRARVAALRDGVEAFGVTLYPSGMRPAFDDRLKFAVGELPGETEALEIINDRLLSANALKKFTSDDVWIHYLEAANSNFIGDRFMFLDGTTLKNLAKAGADGIAFMNSHRTGGLSAPAELPFGRTFAGRYEEHAQPDGSVYKRALLGVYMMRGQYPNGQGQPSTDDLHLAIQSGTVSDVSIGLGNAGEAICDVCARPLEDKDCNHVPGTTENMNPEQIEAQTARGVAGGKASYSIVNGQTLEVSAVYKGAVPGAGFRKAMQFGRKCGKSLAGQSASDILSAYGSLMDDGDKSVFRVPKPPINKGSKAMAFDFFSWIKLGQSVGAIAQDADLSGLENVTAAPAPVAAPAPAQSLAVSPDERAAFEAEKKQLKKDQFGVAADGFILQLKTAGKIIPNEESDVKRTYVLAAMDDYFNPLPDEDGKPVSRLAIYTAAQLARKPHGLDEEQVTTATILPSGEAPDDSKGTPAERLASLLKGTPLGQEVVRALVK